MHSNPGNDPMSLKSLNTRIDKIPDPDLSLLRQQQLYEKLKPLPYEEREELRQRLREQRREEERDLKIPPAERRPRSAPKKKPGKPRPIEPPPRSTESAQPKSAAKPRTGREV